MRYLKSFSENKDEYYTELPVYRDEEDRDEEDIIMSQQSVNYIFNLFPKITIEEILQNSKLPDVYVVQLIEDMGNRFIRIWKRKEYTPGELKIIFFNKRHNKKPEVLEVDDMEFCGYISELKDEYFDVYLCSDTIQGCGEFICDQLDGVKELLSDKGII